MSNIHNLDSELFFKKANILYFENFFKIISFIDNDYLGKKNINLFYTDLYSSLHDYCEQMIRGLVVAIDPSANLVESDDLSSSRSISITKLIDVIKNLYGNDFFIKNIIQYTNFNNLFTSINNKRNSNSHTSYLENVKNIKNDIHNLLNDYIICYYVLNKKPSFLKDYFLYFDNGAINKISAWSDKSLLVKFFTFFPLFIAHNSLANEKIPSHLIFGNLKYFVILFENSNYNNVIFNIEKTIVKINCPDCVEHFGEIYLNYNTLIKTKHNSDLFTCYICDNKLKVEQIKCNKCFIQGKRKSYSINNVCVFCNPLKKEDSKIVQLMKENELKQKKMSLSLDKALKEPLSDQWIAYIEKNFYSYKKEKIGVYHLTKNSCKYLNNKSIVDDLFFSYKESLLDVPHALENIFSTNTEDLNNRKTLSSLRKSNYSKKLIQYVGYYKQVFSFKNCVYLYFNRKNPLTLKKFQVLFPETICRKLLLDHALGEFNGSFDKLLETISDQEQILYLETVVYEKIKNTIRDNVYASYPVIFDNKNKKT